MGYSPYQLVSRMSEPSTVVKLVRVYTPKKLAETNRRCDGLEEVTPFEYDHFLVSMLNFRGVLSAEFVFLQIFHLPAASAFLFRNSSTAGAFEINRAWETVETVGTVLLQDRSRHRKLKKTPEIVQQNSWGPFI